MTEQGTSTATTKTPNVTIYTDGGCIHNPGPGGYGVVLQCSEGEKELSAGYRRTTNNRMELMAAIAGLRALKEPCRVILYSDSQYLVKAMSLGWAKSWRAKNWRRAPGEKARNPDLWETLLRLCESNTVEFRWLRGHAGAVENERCDRLATQAARQGNLLIDEVYERGEVE